MTNKIIKFILESILAIVIIMSAAGFVIEVITRGSIPVTFLQGYITLYLTRMYIQDTGKK